MVKGGVLNTMQDEYHFGQGLFAQNGPQAIEDVDMQNAFLMHNAPTPSKYNVLSFRSPLTKIEN